MICYSIAKMSGHPRSTVECTMVVYDSKERKHIVLVSENIMLKRTFEAKRAEMMGRWRKLHKEELHTF
jgi:hypothetical protein